MRDLRKQRTADFKYLFDNCKVLFEKFSEQNSSHEYFQNQYMLNIVPGGKNGGNDSTIIEIFYGARPFKFKSTPTKWTSSSEYGASLIYQQHDNGFVTVTYFPASTDNLKQKEDFIYYDFLKNTSVLRSEKILKKHFDILVAYMERTSLDGNPNTFQNYLVSKIKFTKPLVVKGQVNQSVLKTKGYQIMNFVLSVGLSGFIILLVTLWLNDDKSDNQQKIIELNKNIERDIHKTNSILDSINNNIRNIKAEKTAGNNG